jgi:protein-S-isoprenylcysteine O-methyltransferase Ste14
MTLRFTPSLAGLFGACRFSIFKIRGRKDEAQLEQHFGATYLEYKHRVKRWIPGII